MGDVPLVIAAQERLAHAIEDLGGVALERILAEQHGESIVGRVGADLDRSPVAAVEHFVHYRNLLGMRPVQGAAQRRVGQRGTIPDDGAEEIGGRSAGQAGEHPLGLAVQVGEAPVGIEGEDALADAVEQIQRLGGVEQPDEPWQ